MSISDQANAAQARLVEAARAFSRLTPRKNPSGAYGRALADLFACRDDFARKTDEEWAAEVAELKVLLRLARDGEINDPLATAERERIDAALED